MKSYTMFSAVSGVTQPVILMSIVRGETLLPKQGHEYDAIFLTAGNLLSEQFSRSYKLAATVFLM
jgi:hypothetical protein